jgi:hypothetical protein
MTKKEKIEELISDPLNKSNYEKVVQHMSDQMVASLNQFGDFDGADSFEEAFRDTQEIITWEAISSILKEIYDKWYTDDEIDFLHTQTVNPIAKQISEKVGNVQVDVMEKMDEAFRLKMLEMLNNDSKA